MLTSPSLPHSFIQHGNLLENELLIQVSKAKSLFHGCKGKPKYIASSKTRSVNDCIWWEHLDRRLSTMGCLYTACGEGACGPGHISTYKREITPPCLRLRWLAEMGSRDTSRIQLLRNSEPNPEEYWIENKCIKSFLNSLPQKKKVYIKGWFLSLWLFICLKRCKGSNLL